MHYYLQIGLQVDWLTGHLILAQHEANNTLIQWGNPIEKMAKLAELALHYLT